MITISNFLINNGFSNVHPLSDGGYVALCPFHKDTKNSFHIYSNGYWKCYAASCGLQGGFERLLELLCIDKKYKNNVLFIEAPKEKKEEKTIPESTFFWMPKPTWYFHNRGYPEIIIDKFNIRYDRKKDMVIFPIYNNQKEVIGISKKSVSGSGPKYLHPENKSNYLYNLWNIKPDVKNVVLTEGFFDVYRLTLYGQWAVACMGSCVSDDQARILERFQLVTIMLDNDDAGFAGAKKSALKLISRGIKIDFNMSYPEDIKDPDELDKLKLQEMLKNKKSFSSFLLDNRLKPCNTLRYHGTRRI